MSTLTGSAMYGTAHTVRYAADVTRRELMGIESTRKVLGKRVDLATETELHTVMTKHGQPIAVIVDIDWYRRAATALKDPTEY